MSADEKKTENIDRGFVASSVNVAPAPVASSTEIIAVETQAHEGHVSDFMKNLPKYFHNLLWLAVFFLTIIYITSLAVSIFVDALSGLQNNWLVSGENMSYIFDLFYSLLFSSLAFAIIVLLVVGSQILWAFLSMPRKKNEYEAEEQYNLGVMYANSKGVMPHKEAAMERWQEAAKKDDKKAKERLDLMYEKGDIVKPNKEKAAQHFKNAAQKGNPQAQFYLGTAYDNGDGMTQNQTKAAKWYKKAAGQGLAEAQFNLGVMYFNGYGMTQNKKEAVKWFKKATKQGYAKAQFNLGVSYFNGYGVTKNQKKQSSGSQKLLNRIMLQPNSI